MINFTQWTTGLSQPSFLHWLLLPERCAVNCISSLTINGMLSIVRLSFSKQKVSVTVRKKNLGRCCFVGLRLTDTNNKFDSVDNRIIALVIFVLLCFS